MLKNQKHAVLYGLAAVFLWSTVATAFKLALVVFTSTQLVFFAALVSWFFLGFCLVVFKRLGEVLPAIAANPVQYGKLGFLNPFLYYIILFQAYDLLPAQQAQSLNYTWAIMLSVLAVPFLGQHLRRIDWVSLCLAYFGVLVICTEGDFSALNFSSPLGVGLALLSTLVWALYWIFNTKSKDHPVVGLFICFSIGLPLIAVLLTWQQAWMLPSAKGWFLAGYVGLFEMGLTFVLWLFAMKKAESTALISNMIFLSPLLSLFFIQYFLGEMIHRATVIGLVLIILGLLLQRLPWLTAANNGVGK